MPDAAHPYAQLPRNRFWKTAVAERGGDAFDALWTPRHALARGTRFATAGSCFAQHISRWLQGHGHTWVDSEPAPAGLDERARADGGYGVFSWRTGNIYTAALLRQWIFWALGHGQPPATAWCEDGRWFDPFRPGIPALGFESEAALHAARAHTVQALRESLLQTDVLVFTLGLTEAWVDADGSVYPMCPGTLRGRFDAARHRFVNFDAAQVQQHLQETFDALRAFNPDLRFLLTVSPVPLTATASEHHVLVATTGSKSVLRAAAGALQAQRDDVDYFPSYELIAGTPSRGRWFDDNLRTVTRAGVDHVMAHFARGLGEPSDPMPATVHTSAAVRPPSPAADELSCEDVMLTSWAPREARHGPGAQQLCLLGDSHMGKLSQALCRAGIAHQGGMIMRASSWFNGVFHRDVDEIFVPLESATARQRWLQTLPFFADDHALPRAQRQVVSSLGLHSHVAVMAYLQWSQKKHGRPTLDLEETLAWYRQANKKGLALLQTLLERGHPVVVLTNPPTQGLYPPNRPLLPIFEAYDLVAQHELKALGCEVVNAREHFARVGWDERYHSRRPRENGVPDWFHGSDLCYDALLAPLAPWLGAAAGVENGAALAA